MSNQSTPSPEEITAARHAGFSDSVAHMPDDRRTPLADSYRAQDARRDKNVNEFYETVTGGNES